MAGPRRALSPARGLVWRRLHGHSRRALRRLAEPGLVIRGGDVAWRRGDLDLAPR